MTIYRVHLADDLEDYEDIELKGWFDDEESAALEFVEERLHEDYGYDLPVDLIINGQLFSVDHVPSVTLEVCEHDLEDDQLAEWEAYKASEVAP